ncbi:MAG: hypothetical protein [Olavius algarvensis Gamma 3 endosymbiont]|nr:MAG: hypothetical protein [Olavius algarvensis Gamma 3 endosymbiont]
MVGEIFVLRDHFPTTELQLCSKTANNSRAIAFWGPNWMEPAAA